MSEILKMSTKMLPSGIEGVRFSIKSKGVAYFQTFFCVPFCAVSFFGDSHVAMPLQEAKLATYLRLKFRTRQSNGILFLAAGRTDYCLLSIDDGRVKLNLKISDHFTEVSIARTHTHIRTARVPVWSMYFIRF